MTGYSRFMFFQKLGTRCLAVEFVLDSMKRLVSVDLIGKKNEVKLEYIISFYLHVFTFADHRQSCFTATVSSRRGTNNQKVLFGNVISQQGTEYDRSTGVYTAAEDGLYVFYVNIMAYKGKYCQGYISKNSVAMAQFYSDGRGIMAHNWQMGGNMVVINLVKGDKVWIQTRSCNDIYPDKYSIFIGCKIAWFFKEGCEDSSGDIKMQN